MAFKKVTSVDYLVVHCAATPPDMDIGAAEIDEWHRAKSWLAIGYHYVIRRDGTLETGRAANTVGAHVRGFNNVSQGICMVGGVDEKGKAKNNFTKAQKTTLKTLLTALNHQHPEARIVGHRDLDDSKECPCFDVKSWWRRVNK
ncbi:N-acetylmuramoyl-L-alanine amidase [Marinicella marina]|uniref:N-acetylmuramoyl-L-alanine amidase n=1 Tax=Marinicella marina TaxID=2996016 RepID=UPI0024BD434B|nr:N-acetylmuramoyl-L-alanine amidase [Marinicella marina]MDJ1139653.1 N-acetylmuramoyl-L-alanine amidase [Marinicella marina]